MVDYETHYTRVGFIELPDRLQTVQMIFHVLYVVSRFVNRPPDGIDGLDNITRWNPEVTNAREIMEIDWAKVDCLVRWVCLNDKTEWGDHPGDSPTAVEVIASWVFPVLAQPHPLTRTHRNWEPGIFDLPVDDGLLRFQDAPLLLNLGL